MYRAGIAFLLGVIALQHFTQLPSLEWCWLLPVFLILAIKLVRFRTCFIFILGFLWALFSAHLQHYPQLPPNLEGKDILLQGYISSIPIKRERNIRFEFNVDKLLNDELTEEVFFKAPLIKSLLWGKSMKLRLNWYGAPADLQAGDRWQLKVRLKAPHGLMNPGGFDYETWLFAQDLHATGYVRKDRANNKLDASASFWILEKRQALVSLLTELDGQLKHIGIISALTVGDRQNITKEQWSLFRNTGTSHLIAISGLHVGLIATLVFFCTHYIARLLLPVLMRCRILLSAQQVAAFCAMSSALFYAALAGFSLPTIRAFIMLSVFMLGLLLNRPVRIGYGLCLALLIILFIDPFAVNSPSFWLSFTAVTVLAILLSNRFDRAQRWYQWGRLQLMLAIALLPITLIWFQQAAFSASLSNLFAIPLVGMIVVPLTLLGSVLLSVSSDIAIVCLQLADFLLAILLSCLDWVATWPLGQWRQHTPLVWTWPFAAVGMLLLLMPSGFPYRWLGLIFLSPLFLVKPSQPAHGHVWLTVLDVGQGLAIVARTQEYVLVYDTGARFSAEFDMGQSVIVPFLRHEGLKHIDLLLVSHGDNDHIGGAASLIKAILPDQVLTSAPELFEERTSLPASYCEQGINWQWNGVDFTILHPAIDWPNKTKRDGNNASCVLQIKTQAGRILLTGDIEKEAERALLKASLKSGLDLSADLLLVPHHGSRTSSTRAFIDAVKPQYAVISAGYRNRFKLPNANIVKRYQDSGAQIWSTYESGALMFQLTDKQLLAPQSYRSQYRRYWHYPVKVE